MEKRSDGDKVREYICADLFAIHANGAKERFARIAQLSSKPLGISHKVVGFSFFPHPGAL